MNACVQSEVLKVLKEMSLVLTYRSKDAFIR